MPRSLAAFLLLAALLAPAASADWPSFHNDERNSGLSSGTAYKPYEDVWWNSKISPDTQVEASPVVSKGIVVVADWNKKVRALDAASGAEKWNVTMGAKIVGTPAIAKSWVFVVDTAGTLNKYDLVKGTLQQTITVGPTLGSPAIHENVLFIGNEAGEMKAYAIEQMDLLWKFAMTGLFERIETTVTGTAPNTVATVACKDPITAGPIRGKPAVIDGKVYFGSLNHFVFAVNEQGESGQTTKIQWFYKTGEAIFASPLVDYARDRIIIGSYDENLYSFPASPAGGGPLGPTGQPPCTAFNNLPVWTYKVPSDIGQSKVHSSAATDGARIYVGANNGALYAVNAVDGTKAWAFLTGASIISSPAVANGVVVVGSDDARVYWVNATGGAKLKEFAGQAAFKSSPAIDGDRAFIVSFEGEIYMFGPKVPPRADLAVTVTGATATGVTLSVRNTGSDTAAATKVRVFASGVQLGEVAVPAITAQQSATLTLTAAVPAGTQAIKATVDPENAVEEANENNNDFTLTATIAAPGPAPTSAVSTTKKKSPEAGLLFAVGLLTCAAAARRRR
ncbi:MAG TPA: PQQ-binding-like beta-propeller repeat protein [Candidatus Thermoplasmatota archaeon]|nr:PQQ-binding-like beta-propeller repeat protein [Candidatus Thermoplasmatota archaeon]